MQHRLTLLFSFFIFLKLSAQRMPDNVYDQNIKTVALFQQANQQSLPIIQLNENNPLELHFDDLSGVIKNYYYTLVLCNADWKPADLSPFDYLRGFPMNRIVQYRPSTITNSHYIHYQALIPERNLTPTKSGNYLLKVFLDSDTSKLVFTKRVFVVDRQVAIGADIQRPFDNTLLRTHQKIMVQLNTQQLNILSPQQTKLFIVQNNQWESALKNLQPVFIRGKMFEYNTDQMLIFQAAKEFRWADLRSFRFLSDRVDRVEKWKNPVELYLKEDLARAGMSYVFFNDRNGWNEISNTESVNPWWQSDYANVHFTYVPANHQPYLGRSVYIIGQLANNQMGEASKMIFDSTRGVYTKSLLLKQGYYSYLYATKLDKTFAGTPDFSITEGNYWETENEYTILFYYRSFSSRHDELLGISSIQSGNIR